MVMVVCDFCEGQTWSNAAMSWLDPCILEDHRRPPNVGYPLSGMLWLSCSPDAKPFPCDGIRYPPRNYWVFLY